MEVSHDCCCSCFCSCCLNWSSVIRLNSLLFSLQRLYDQSVSVWRHRISHQDVWAFWIIWSVNNNIISRCACVPVPASVCVCWNFLQLTKSSFFLFFFGMQSLFVCSNFFGRSPFLSEMHHYIWKCKSAPTDRSPTQQALCEQCSHWLKICKCFVKMGREMLPMQSLTTTWYLTTSLQFHKTRY